MSQDLFPSIVNFIKAIYPGENPVPLHAPRFVGNEKKYVLDAIDSTFVSSVGEYVDRFENMLCDITGANYSVAVVNGTAALHTALMLLGVKKDDLVITQPLSFVATANAIAYCGAEPLFVDVDKNNLGLNPEALESFLIENAILKNKECVIKTNGIKISACLPVHVFGHPCRIDHIIDICDRYHIPVIEDCAESIGSLYKKKHTGTFGEIGIFSFNGNKTITCGGGGAFITNNEKLGKLGKHLTTTAKIPHNYEYIHDRVGYNYRLPNINAALACAQLEKLDEFILKKRELADTYANFFYKLGISVIKEEKNARSNYWLNAIILDNKKERDSFLQISNENEILTRPAWRLLNKLPMYSGCNSYVLDNAEWLEDRLVNIPSSVPI